MRNVSDKVKEKMKIHILCSILLLNQSVYEIMWINIAEPGRPQMTIRCMCNACWIPKTTNIHSEYTILIDFSTAAMVAWKRLNVTSCSCHYQHILLRMVCRNIHRWNYKHGYMYNYSFIVCIEFHVTSMQTRFCWRCPHHTHGWAGLLHALQDTEWHDWKIKGQSPK